jgi:rhamnosyltransferase
LKIALCIPTLNAAATLEPLVSALKSQTRQPDVFLVIDSGSIDNSPSGFQAAGARLHLIPRGEFNHGGTRQIAVAMVPDAEIIVFLTQDAILADCRAMEHLLACFEDEKVGVAYGRQLPNEDATPIAAHARLFNYPSESSIKTLSDRSRLGIKTAFISNSFAAYRRSALMSIGGFPSDAILSEDTYVATKMLQDGWKIAYCAEAQAYHSHNYSIIEECRRYFDIGVFHSRETWFMKALGKAEGEGKRFVVSEMKYLLKQSPWHIPSALLRTFFKYLGYKLGWLESRIPVGVKKKLSMNRGYWKEPLA